MVLVVVVEVVVDSVVDSCVVDGDVITFCVVLCTPQRLRSLVSVMVSMAMSPE